MAEKTIAAMKRGTSARHNEIWTMYQTSGAKIKIITAWKYPGKSPARNPIPGEIMEEIKNIIG